MPGWFQESVAADPRPAFPAEAPRTPPAAGPMPLAQKLLLGAAFFGPVLAALLTFAEVYGSFTQLRSSLAAVAFACLVGFTSLLVVVLGLNALIRRSLPPEERPVRNRRRAFYSVVLCFMAILLVGSMIFPYVATEDPLAPGQSEVTEDGSTPNVFTPPGATPEPSSPGE